MSVETKEEPTRKEMLLADLQASEAAIAQAEREIGRLSEQKVTLTADLNEVDRQLAKARQKLDGNRGALIAVRRYSELEQGKAPSLPESDDS